MERRMDIPHRGHSTTSVLIHYGMNIKFIKSMDVLQILNAIFTGFTVVVAIVAVVLAYKIGLKQNEINDRLLTLQDYVAISVAPGQDSTISLWNTGKSNLYLWGFDMPNNDIRFEKPRLISAAAVSNYWIPAPNLGKISTTTNFEFMLYLTDEYNNKWTSEAGGEAIPTKFSKDGKEVPATIIKVWSYKTYRKDWQIK